MTRLLTLLLILLWALPAPAQTITTSPSGANLPGSATNDTPAAGTVGEYANSICIFGAATVTITLATPAVITYTAHGISSTFGGGACPIVFTTTGALPSHIVSGTTYYIAPSSITANTFSISTTVQNALAGTLITTLGDTQSGVQTGTLNAGLANATAANLTAVSLTAGDWDVWGQTINFPGGSTVTTLLQAGVTSTSATIPLPTAGVPGRADCAYGAGITGGNAITCSVLPARISLAATTTIFLVASDSFTTSTMVGFGYISARRRR